MKRTTDQNQDFLVLVWTFRDWVWIGDSRYQSKQTISFESLLLDGPEYYCQCWLWVSVESSMISCTVLAPQFSQWIHLAASLTLQLTARSSPCPVKTLKNGTIISFSDIWPVKFEPKLTSCLDRNCWMLSFYYPSEIVLLTGRVIGMVRSEWQLLALVCTRGLHIGRILWLNLDRAEQTVLLVNCLLL